MKNDGGKFLGLIALTLAAAVVSRISISGAIALIVGAALMIGTLAKK